MSIQLFLILTVLLVALGVPMIVSLSLPSICFLLTNNIAIDIVIQRYFNGMNAMVLLCIPFFILAGDIMGKGGIAQRLIDFASAIFGNVTGSMAYVGILACVFFSAVSGSGIACCFAMGSIFIPEMVKNGYSRPFASSVIASSSIMDPIIPPSISLVVYGTLTGASIRDLYTLGIPTGLLMAIGLMFVVFFKCKFGKKGDYVAPRDENGIIIKKPRPPFLQSLVKASWGLGAPVIILGGIMTGVVTPTEASVIAVLYSLLVSIVIYRELTLKELPQMLLEAGKTTARIFFIIASATLFAWVLTYESVPQMIMSSMLSVSSNPLVMLLIFNAIFLFMGMFMESSSMYVIGIPMFLPILKALGIDLVYFGVLISLNAAIGLITPPFGTVLFAGSSVGNVPVHEIMKRNWPFILSQLAVLLAITFVPGLVMWIL